jgi:hypothetical protein
MSAVIVAASAPFAFAARSWLARQLARSTRNALRGVPPARSRSQEKVRPRGKFFSGHFSLRSELADRAGNAECAMVALPKKRSFLPPKSTGPEAGNCGH